MEDIFNNYTETCTNDKDKYIVCSCAKGENDYIIEWVNHYLNLGFDKLVIADNNDDDSLDILLKTFIENGFVELINFRNTEMYQVPFYTEFCRFANYKWCAYFDMDEFLEIPRYNNIKDLLDSVKEDVICFNWMVYGHNDQYNYVPDSLENRFKIPVCPISIYKENMFIKSIVRGSYKFEDCSFNGSHIPFSDTYDITYNICGVNSVDSTSHMNFPPIYKTGYIKHYYTKSLSEWVTKAERGWPDGTRNLNIANFFKLNSYELPLSLYKDGLFTKHTNGLGDYNDLMDKYDVIYVNTNDNTYALLTELARMMECTTDHTFIVDLYLDDTLFNILLEIAIRTGNRLVACENYDEIWNVYLKYNKGKNNTYYIITVY